METPETIFQEITCKSSKKEDIQQRLSYELPKKKSIFSVPGRGTTSEKTTKPTQDSKTSQEQSDQSGREPGESNRIK